MIHFLLLVSRQGKVRLSRWYSPSLFAGQSSGGAPLPPPPAAAAASSASSSAAGGTSKKGRPASPGTAAAAATEAEAAAATGLRRGEGGGGSRGVAAAAGGGGPGAAAAATIAAGEPSSARRVFPAAGRQKRGELLREAASKVLQRNAKMSNVVEWREETRLVYKRYASLFFIACIDSGDNPLLTLEMIHHFVEILDKYFGNVCELDLIFNFHKAYYLLDETISAGELQESSKKVVLRVMNAQDALMEESHEKGGSKLT